MTCEEVKISLHDFVDEQLDVFMTISTNIWICLKKRKLKRICADVTNAIMK